MKPQMITAHEKLLVLLKPMVAELEAHNWHVRDCDSCNSLMSDILRRAKEVLDDTN